MVSSVCAREGIASQLRTTKMQNRGFIICPPYLNSNGNSRQQRVISLYVPARHVVLFDVLETVTLIPGLFFLVGSRIRSCDPSQSLRHVLVYTRARIWEEF